MPWIPLDTGSGRQSVAGMCGGCPSDAALLVTQVNTVHETVAVVELASKSASRRLRHRAHTQRVNTKERPRPSTRVRVLDTHLASLVEILEIGRPWS